MRQFMDIAKAVSDENRVRTLLFLRRGELCLCQIMALLELAPSTVSKHMNILRQANLIEGRKQGLWHYYRRPDKPTLEVQKTFEWLDTCLGAQPLARQDAKRLAHVRTMDLEELCVRYRK